MNRNQNFKTLDEKKQELANLKSEWEEMKKQEKELKEKFYNSPFEKRAKIKKELKILQDAIFEKKDCGTSMKIDVRDEELLQHLKNPVGNPTDPRHLANLIKEELRATLDGSRKFEAGNRVGNIWETGDTIQYFGRNKEIRKGIANLARNRQKPLDPERIVSRQVRVKRSDFSSTDFDEMINLVRQVKDLLEEQDKQDQQRTENIKLNNPHLFTQWRCSTDGKYNGRGVWENWHTFSGKNNGHNYEIYVPDNHIALTNVLFDNGWGTNSEVNKFFVVTGVAEPTTLYYWNVDKQKQEIIFEAEAQRLESQGKGNYINYKTYVDLDDKIMIDHYRENEQQDLAKLVGGANELAESNDRRNISGAAITHQKANHQLDNEFLLKYFQKHDIKQIELTSEGNLLIKYNSGKSEIITSEQTNNQELQKVINYYQKSQQTSLSQKELLNMKGANSFTSNKNPNNNTLLISCVIGGGALVIGMGIGLLLWKRKIKKG